MFRSHNFFALFLGFIVSLILSVPACGQGQVSSETASVSGVVTDGTNSAVVGATVRLRLQNGKVAGSVVSEPNGRYFLSAIPAGEYEIEVEKAGLTTPEAVSLNLNAGEDKKIDLQFGGKRKLNNDSLAKSGAASNIAPPQFFDEPKFTVAGVTDVWHYGGHGSDPALRDSESLAKSAAALSTAAGPKRDVSAEPAKTASKDPLSSDYEANFNRGKDLADQHKYQQALPFLETASHLSSINISPRDEATLHELLGVVQEQVGNPLEAVREYESAAKLDPSESNLFAWGAELLLHGAFEPAIEVFSNGEKRFPESIRMRLGLSVAWYARGSHDEAAQILCAASDLNPKDADPYTFMGRIQSAAPKPPACFAARLARFASLEPQNAMANYFYAVTIWKSRQNGDDEQAFARAKELLQKSIRLDPKLAVAYLQLGMMEDERKNIQQAIADYRKSIELDSGGDQAHYRLAQIYARIGEKTKAQEELDLYRKIQSQQAGEAERERHEMPQFVYTLKEPDAKPTH